MRRKSVSAILSHVPKRYNFDGEWAANFGQPEIGSKWMVWGPSAAGKSSFVMQLAKYMCRFGHVEYYADEEGVYSESLKRRLMMYGMKKLQRRFVILDRCTIQDVISRMEMSKGSDIYIFDSWQTMNFTYEDFKMLCRRYPKKTMIWVSRAERNEPMGNSARKAKFDCDVKIFVRGYAAKCLGRFTPEAGQEYIIWDEGYASLMKKMIK